MLKSRLLPFAFALLLFAVPVAAAPLVSVSSGSLAVTAFLSSAGSTYDIRGAIGTNVSSGGPTSSAVAIFDPVGGTDPGVVALPFGNSILVAADDQTSVSGLYSVLYVNFGLISFPTPTTIVLPTFAALSTPSGVPGPGLAALVNSNPLYLSFALTAVVLESDFTIAQWTLTGISGTSYGPPSPVPEPGTLGLLASSVVFAAVTIRVRRR